MGRLFDSQNAGTTSTTTTWEAPMGETALEYKKRKEAGLSGADSASGDSSKAAVQEKMESTDLGAAARKNAGKTEAAPKTMELQPPAREEGESALVYAGRVSRWKKAQQAGQARALEKK